MGGIGLYIRLTVYCVSRFEVSQYYVLYENTKYYTLAKLTDVAAYIAPIRVLRLLFEDIYHAIYRVRCALTDKIRITWTGEASEQNDTSDMGASVWSSMPCMSVVWTSGPA